MGSIPTKIKKSIPKNPKYFYLRFSKRCVSQYFIRLYLAKVLFDYIDDSENYRRDVSEVWDLDDCSYNICNKLTRKEKEGEMETMSYYEYIEE